LAAVLAAVLSAWLMFIHSFAALFPVRFFMVLCAGTLEPALNVWLAKRVPEERQGVAFGLASTTRSIGWAVGPLLAGAVAAVHLRAVFGVASAGYLGLALLFALGLRARRKSDTRTT
jgi:MFS family permease